MDSSAKRVGVLSSHLALAVVPMVTALALGPGVARAGGAVERARAYLKAAQQPGGDFPGIPVIDTAEAVAALESGRERDAALFALSLARPDNTEAALARSVALSGTPFFDPVADSALRAALIAEQLGLAPSSGGIDGLVLAEAFRFAATQVDGAVLAGGLLPVAITLQHADGGFGFADNDSDPALTADVVRTLRGLSQTAALRKLAQSFLVQRFSGSLSSYPAADLALATLATLDLGEALHIRLITELLARQDAAGSFDGGDTRATALAIEALSAALPDLVLSRPSFLSTAPAKGSDYVLPLTVRNAGLSSSPPTTGSAVVTNSSGQVVFTGSFSVPALSPGAATTVNVDLGVQGAIGARMATVVVNPSSDFAEASFDNNVLSVAYRVADLADLAISSADIAASPSPPSLYQSLDVTVRVSNIGDAVAEHVHVQLFQGQPSSGGLLIAEKVFNAVAPGTPRVLTGRVVPATLDPLLLVARIDPQNAIAESREDNNLASLQLVPVKPAEILVDVGAQGPVSRVLKQGDAAVLSYGGYVSITRYNTTYPDLAVLPVQQIDALLTLQKDGTTTFQERSRLRKNFSMSTYVTLPTEGLDGTYQVTAAIDPDGLIADINRSNNTVSSTLTIVTDDLPELSIDPASLRSEPERILPGTTATLHARLRNTGKRAAQDIPVTVTMPSGTAAVSVPSLPAGGSADLAVPFDATTLGPALYQATWSIDPQATILENSRQNNTVVFPVRIAGADLTITSIAQSPLPAPVNTTAAVVVGYRNDGVARTNPLYASVSLPSVTVTAPALDPGQSGSLTLPVPTAGMVGEVPLQVSLWNNAPGQGFLRQDFTLRVSNPDFGVSLEGVALAPERAAPGSMVTASIIVTNSGNLDAATSVHLYRGYPEGGDQVTAGSLFVPVGGSAVYTSPEFATPAQSPFVITVVLNEEGTYPEPSLLNNRVVRGTLKRPGEVVVAFDETHRPIYTVSTNPAVTAAGGVAGDYADWGADLEARGYTVTTLNPDADGLTASKLVGVHALVLGLPTEPYSPAEIETLQRYLRDGGGLLYEGEWGDKTYWQPAEDEFLAALGIGLVNARTVVGIPGVTCSGQWPHFERAGGTLAAHPVTEGIDDLWGAATGGFSSVPAGSTLLLKTGPQWSPAGLAVAGVFPYGSGRGAFIADTNFFDGSYSYTGPTCGGAILYRAPGNQRFALQLIDWLVNGGPGDYLPDLAFAPSRLQVPAVVISGEQVPLSAVVKNVGGALGDAAGAVVRFHLGEPGSGTLLGESLLPDVGIDEGLTVGTTWNASVAPGAYLLSAVVDPDDRVKEYLESNNLVRTTVLVRPAHDLRIDPSDLVAVPGAMPMLKLTVHNLGYLDAPAGVEAKVTEQTQTTITGLATVSMPTIPARGMATVSIPWMLLDRTLSRRLSVEVDTEQALVDYDRSNNSAFIDLEPPTLEVAAPLPETSWGGRREVCWIGFSLERTLGYFVALAAEGQPFTGLGGSQGRCFTLDTRGYPDGRYRLRVTASDGLLEGVAEVPFTIDNLVAGVRGFGSGSSAATASLGPWLPAAIVSLPVNIRVLSATATADYTPAESTVVSPTLSYDTMGPSLFEVRGALYYLYSRYEGSLNVLGYQRSDDDGVTWSPFTRISAEGQAVGYKSAAVNSYGVHVVYTAGSTVYYTRSPDGKRWTAPVALEGAGGGSPYLSANDEGLALAFNWPVSVGVADPSGDRWSPVVSVTSLSVPAFGAVVGAGFVHLLGAFNLSLKYVRAPWDGTRLAAFGAATDIPSGLPHLGLGAGRAMAGDGALTVAFQAYVPPYELRVQRCDLARDCTAADDWMPEPIRVARPGASYSLARPAAGRYRMAHVTPAMQLLEGEQSGRRWTAGVDAGIQPPSEPATLLASDFAGVAGRYNQMIYRRYPGLTPVDLQLDVGGDGSPELARPGMPGTPKQLADFAGALNAYLSSHADGDDGVVDGRIEVPITATSRGAGTALLRNLEVRYQPLSQVAGFAEPSLFSPGASPGVLDSSRLSLLSSNPAAVMTPAGQIVRTLATAGAGGRYVATFDGRDELGALLQSGPYLFGPPGWPVGGVEIDDILPTAAISSGADGTYGGRAPIYGTATDSDYAGSSKNFSRYLLEYSLDGTTYSSIATGTTPIVNGLLGTWDTRALSQGAATLRLTAYDRAGNSTSTTRGVNVSPGAPQAPVIDRPAVAGAPVDSLSSIVAVSGSAEPNTSVTVFLNGVAVGTTSSDGRWTLSGVNLPSGIATITASATRNSLESPRSRPIEVAAYSLAVAISVPAHATAGSDVSATVTATRTSVQATPLTIRISATDSTGKTAPIGLSPSQQIVTFAGLGSASFPVTISTRNAPPGTYQITAQVISGGLIPATGSASLELDPAMSLSATLASDKAIYDALQVVSLSSRIFNTGNNPGSGPLSATIVVTEPTGPVVVLGPFSVASIPAGQLATLSTLFGAPPLPVGVYVADLYVDDATGVRVAAATTSFEVQPANGAGELTGALVVTPVTYVPGDVLSAAFTVTNSGGDAQVSVTVMLLDQVTSAIVARSDQLLTIPHGSTVPGVAALSTRGAAGNELIALLIGNGRGLAGQAIAPSPIHDTTPPVITIAGVSQDEYRSGSVTPVITVTDSESPFTWQAKLNDQPFTSGTEITGDGDYHLVVNAEDIYGNAATAERHFTIDRTPPLISISGVTDGELTNLTVFPVVQITELYLASESELLDGLTWDGLPVVAEGDHVLEVEAADLAGNESQVTVHFTIDKTPPVILIVGVADGQVTQGPVGPIITVTDPHSPTYTATLNGQPFASGSIVSAEGTYELLVNAADAAGNQSSPVTVRFAIDQTGPAIEVTGVTDGQVTRGPVVPVITVTDPCSPTYTATLNSQPFVSGSSVATEGEYDLSIHAADCAGNTSQRQLHFAVDLTPPVITIGGVTDGGVYHQPVTPAFSATDLHAPTVSATLDGAPFQSGTVVQANGVHTLLVTAQDAAGNTASASATFTILSVDGSLVLRFDEGPRVLVALDCHHDDDDDEDDDDEDDDDEHEHSARCGDGDHGSGGDCSRSALLSALRSAAIPYQVSQGDEELKRKFRSHRHNVLVLYRSDSDEDHLAAEIREATYAGDGLVVVNIPPADADPKLEPALGVDFLGKLHTVGQVTLLPGDLGSGGALTIAGSGIVQRLEGATAAGTTASGKVVLSTYRYGSGRSVTFTFDPELNGTAPQVADLLVAAVRFAAGGQQPEPIPGSPQYLEFVAHLSSGGPLDFQLTVTTASGLQVVEAPLATSLDPVIWLFTLPTGESAERHLTVTATEIGSYRVDGLLTALVGGQPMEVAAASLDVEYSVSLEELKSRAEAAVSALSCTGRDRTLKADALQHLSQVRLPPRCGGDGEESIEQVLEAIDDVRQMSAAGAPAALGPLEELLRAVEVVSTTFSHR